jgi:hypothetical protein
MAIWYILWQFGKFCGNVVYSVAIWYILWQFGIFYGNLVYFTTIWYILWSFGTYIFVWISCTKKYSRVTVLNLALRSGEHYNFWFKYVHT